MSAYVWAVDVQTSYLAFGFAPVDGGAVDVETLPMRCDLEEGERLALIDDLVAEYAMATYMAYEPACVWVEQPTGRFLKPQLMYVAGVVQAALFRSLGGVPVWTIPVSTWKKNSVGAGNASKEQVRAWVARQDARPATQDEADAYAIAFAGREMFVQRRWEVAA